MLMKNSAFCLGLPLSFFVGKQGLQLGRLLRHLLPVYPKGN